MRVVMHQFEVSPAGRVRETTVRDVVEKLKERFPDIDASALEANLMVGRAYQAMEDARTTYYTGYGVTGPRYSVLRLLYTAEGHRMTMGEIAAGISKGTPNITQLIDGLEREGLVARVAGEVDKRVIYATLTPEGEHLFQSIFPVNERQVHALWAPLTEDERGLLIHLLAKMRMNVLMASMPLEPDAGCDEVGADATRKRGRGRTPKP